MAFDLLTKSTVAEKTFKANLYGAIDVEREKQKQIKECKIAELLDHENIVKHLEPIENVNEIYIIFEYVPETLHEEIYGSSYKFDITRIWNVARMLMSAISHMRSETK